MRAGRQEVRRGQLAQRNSSFLSFISPRREPGAKTAASTLYRSTKLRLTAFMTEGAGLAAVVAAAAKTRGIGCKGDLVRSFLIPSHFAGGSTKIALQNITRSVVVKSRYLSICRKPIRNAAISLSMI